MLDSYLIPALDGVAYGLVLFLAAGGLTLAYGVGRILNLAHGTLCALGAYTGATLSHGTWPSLLVAIALGTVAGAGGGTTLATLLAPVADRGPLDPSFAHGFEQRA